MTKAAFITPFMLVLIVLSTCTTKDKKETLPVTSNSEAALDLYHQASTAIENVYIGKAFNLLDSALSVDPDFFMAAYTLSTVNLWLGDSVAFKKYADIAIHSNLKLSKGETLLKSALKELVENPDTNVIALGQELVTMYPYDPIAYYQLANFQAVNNDFEGMKENYHKLLDMVENPAPIYNMLGYTYMFLNQLDSAKDAFDKYLELEPALPNPYDSKGDYFMKTGEYGNAYDSYMKAYHMDSIYFASSLTKAKEAKAMEDSTVVHQE